MSSAAPAQPWSWIVSTEIGTDKWYAACSCGWMETGWPDHDIAKASLQKHLGANHGRFNVTA